MSKNYRNSSNYKRNNQSWGNVLSRQVPLTVRLKILFGGFTNQFGWFFFGFGLIFVWAFGGSETLRNLAFFSGKLKETKGTVYSVIETNYSINDRRVYDFMYEYVVDKKHLSGSSDGFLNDYKKGSKITVEYAASDIARSRIKGASKGIGGMLFAMIFPSVGLCFIFFGLKKGMKGCKLLKTGKLAVGKLISTTRTNTQVNKQTVYKFTFQFTADDGQNYKATAKSHERHLFAGEDDLEVPENANANDVLEPLLYLPNNPEYAILLDDLPGGPRLDEMGNVKPAYFSFIGSLFIPGIFMTAHSWWFLKVLEIL